LFHISIWGTWSFVWGAKPTKAPRDDGTYVCIGVLGVYLIERCNSRHKTCSADIPNVVHFIIHTKFFSDWSSKADF